MKKGIESCITVCLIVERKCSVQREMPSKLQLNWHDMFTISVDDVKISR